MKPKPVLCEAMLNIKSSRRWMISQVPASDAKPWPSAAAAALMVKPWRLDNCFASPWCIHASDLLEAMLEATFPLAQLVQKALRCPTELLGASILPEELGAMMEDMMAPCSDTLMRTAQNA